MNNLKESLEFLEFLILKADKGVVVWLGRWSACLTFMHEAQGSIPSTTRQEVCDMPGDS